MGLVSQYETPLPRGHLFGLTLSNNAGDATNDIDFAAGSARNSTDFQNLVLASAMTKQLDVAWAAGSAAGGRMSAAAIADTTYHCFIIGKPDGTTDVGFDVSATAPTLPTGYTTFRRLGSIMRISGAIKAFTQLGDRFTWAISVLDLSVAVARAMAVLAVTIPLGVVVRPILTGRLIVQTVGDIRMNFSSTLANGVNVVGGLLASSYDTNTVEYFLSNTSGQVGVEIVVSSGTISQALVITSGWVDDRGRSA